MAGERDATQITEWLHSTQNSGLHPPASHKSGAVTHTWEPRSPGDKRGSEIQSHSWLQSEFTSRLDCRRICPKQKTKQKNKATANVWFWLTDRMANQGNRLESRNECLHLSTKDFQIRVLRQRSKEKTVSKKGAWKGVVDIQESEFATLPNSMHKSKQKWITDLTSYITVLVRRCHIPNKTNKQKLIWGDGSAIERTGCYSKGLWFNSQYSLGGL